MTSNFTLAGALFQSSLRRAYALLFFVVLGYMAQAQTCTIDVLNCPPPDLTSPVCASKQGAPGQPDSGFVTWTAPKFALNCGTGADGFNFQMKWDLPENKLASGCWEFNRVQRTGQSGNGTLNLWKSTGSNPPLFATPFLYFTGATDFKVTLYGQNNYDVMVYLVPINDQNNPELVWTINVPGDGVERDYTNTITPSGGDGNYKVRFVFETAENPGGKTNYIDLVAINAILASTSCGSGIDFIVTGPNPGYYAEGTTNVAYTATYTPTSGTPLSASCPFAITVVPNVPTITCPTVAASYPAAQGSCSASLSFTATAGNGSNCVGAAPGVEYFVGANKITFPYAFPVGTTTVKAIATNGFGRTAECTFNVVVVDNQAPSITCPSPASFNTNPGVCTSSQTLTATATDNCGVANIKYYIGQNFTTEIVFPYAFPVGTTPVRAVATDIHGNTSNCTYNVTVVDNQNPVVTCPANASFNVDAGSCASSRSFSASATDNCGVASISYAIGANTITFPYAFPVGTTTVTARATDVNGNTATCSFTVTVTDNIAPTITCPTVAASYNNTPGQCGASLSFNATAQDNCGVGSITYKVGENTISFPYFFPIGSTTVTAQATDVNGNTSSTCSFTVVVVDNEPATFVCTPNVISTTQGNCDGAILTLTPPMLVDNCTTPQYTVTGTRSDGKPVGDPYPAGTTTVTWTARDAQQTVLATCVTTVNVTDGTILANYTFARQASDYPYAADETAAGINSAATSAEPFNNTGSGATITGPNAFKVNAGNNGALVMQSSEGDNTRFFEFVVSGAALAQYGKFQVYFMAERLPQAANTLTLRYSTDGVSYTDAGTFDLPNQSIYYEKRFDLSGIAALNTYSLSNLFFRIYASGSNSGSTSASTRLEIDNFQVLGVTKELSITCNPDVQVILTSTDICEGAPTIEPPVATGRCGQDVMVTGVRSDGKPLSDPYPLGVTTITWTATDEDGNTAMCTQKVIVHGVIDAVDDAYTLDKFAGIAGNVLTNDKLDCAPATTSNVKISVVTPAEADGVTLDETTGNVQAVTGTPDGTYFIVYKICAIASDTPRCDMATVTLSVTGGPLPVTGLRLYANRAGNDVNLNWITISEQNTSHFIIERSLDGINFGPIPVGNRMNAAGNSNSQRSYAQVDRNIISQVVYYRVRLYDNDGSFRLSNVVAVRMNQGREFRVYPNPVVNMFTIEFAENGLYRVDLISASGQLIQLHREVIVTNSSRNLTIPRNNLISGMYELRVTNTTTGEVHVVKLVYQPQ